ncbi:hypothetical protein E2C01_034652 [Portunus trituberculatus]|uniref:Uncharacterized protein n=1 Tax=Portunus trituberculatus TaxID=210409 RepID=A0A5B7F243_PORTR|nr:hypothetical protein [Portunus trituberculatus]
MCDSARVEEEEEEEKEKDENTKKQKEKNRQQQSKKKEEEGEESKRNGRKEEEEEEEEVYLWAYWGISCRPAPHGPKAPHTPTRPFKLPFASAAALCTDVFGLDCTGLAHLRPCRCCHAVTPPR